jgi:hypothetical protein
MKIPNEFNALCSDLHRTQSRDADCIVRCTRSRSGTRQPDSRRRSHRRIIYHAQIAARTGTTDTTVDRDIIGSVQPENRTVILPETVTGAVGLTRTLVYDAVPPLALRTAEAVSVVFWLIKTVIAP